MFRPKQPFYSSTAEREEIQGYFEVMKRNNGRHPEVDRVVAYTNPDSMRYSHPVYIKALALYYIHRGPSVPAHWIDFSLPAPARNERPTMLSADEVEWLVPDQSLSRVTPGIAPNQTTSVSQSNGHTRTETYNPATGIRTVQGQQDRAAPAAPRTGIPHPLPDLSRFKKPETIEKKPPAAPSSSAPRPAISRDNPPTQTPASRSASPASTPEQGVTLSARLQGLLREIGMENTGTGMRQGLSALGKLGWATWLEEREAKLSERRMRTRALIAQQMGGLVDERATLSATSHRADLQDIRQAYELEEAQRDPRSLLPAHAPTPPQALPALPMPQTRALPAAPAPLAITDEDIDALAYVAILGFATQNWGETEWNGFLQDIHARCPENVAHEVHRRVLEMEQKLN